MKAKIIIPLIAAALLTGCNLESDTCPKVVQIPFESVDIPDSVDAGEAFTIDVKLYDYGCYTDTKVIGQIFNDTVYLEAYANHDECDCPKVSKNVQSAYNSITDTSLQGATLYYVYMQVNNTKDSVYVCLDSVKIR